MLPRPSRHPRRPRLPAAAAIVVALVAGACGPATPTSSPSSAAQSSSPAASASPSPTPGASVDNAAVYKSIEEQVVKLRELQPKTAVDPKILNETELKARVDKAFKEDNPAALIAANERLLKGLGLLPEGDSLADLYLEMLGSQVAGFYDPDAKELFVVSRTGALGPAERVTFAHEYTHALQDQNFDLKKFDTGNVGAGDRALAQLSVIEGDATAVMSFWTQQHLDAGEQLELLRQSLDPAALAILEKMPPILRDSLQFPYQQGLTFVIGLQGQGGWRAVDAALRDPPTSSEQVMHPQKYASREPPLDVKLPANLATGVGADWKSSLEDTLGEFQLSEWLRTGNSAQEATAGAAGWGGDRVAVLEGPGGSWAIVLVTAWDSPQDADDFRAAAARTIDAIHAASATIGPLQGVRQTIVIAGDDASLAKVDAALGLN